MIELASVCVRVWETSFKGAALAKFSSKMASTSREDTRLVTLDQSVGNVRVRRWQLTVDGHTYHEWVTAVHDPTPHTLLGWDNVPHSQLELSVSCGICDTDGFSRVARGLKPFAKELLVGGGTQPQQATRLLKVAHEEAQRHGCRLLTSAAFQVGDGSYQGLCAHWAVSVGLELRWEDAFCIERNATQSSNPRLADPRQVYCSRLSLALDSIASDYDALLLPLLVSERERRSYHRCWRRVRATWAQLRSLPIGDHPRGERRGELLQDLQSLGHAAACESLFRGRASVSTAAFRRRLKVLVPTAGRRSVAALRAHLQRRRARCPWWWHALRHPSAGRRRKRPRVQARSLHSLLAASPAPTEGGGGARQLWDCFDPRTPEHMVLNGLLFGFPLASTAGLLLIEISRRRIRLSSKSLSQARAASEVARAAVGRRFDATLWASLQPGRTWPLDASTPADWTVDEVVDERNEPVAHAGHADGVRILVLIRTALRSASTANG